MERMILDTIKHARDVSKKGMDVKFILRRISQTSSANLDEDVIKIKIMEMINKRIIEKSYKIRNEHGLQQTNRQMQPRRSAMTILHNIQKKQVRPLFIYFHRPPARTSKNQETLPNMRPIAFTTLASDKNNFHDTKHEEYTL